MTAAKIQQVAATADSVKRTKTAASRAESQRVAESIARTMKAAELDQHNIAVQFEDGVARLSGWVSSEKQKKKATRVVGRVQGVRWIDNRLELAPNKPAGLARRLAISRRPAKVQPRFAEQRPQQRKSFGSALRPASWKRPQESHSGRPSGGFPNSVRNLGVFSRLGNSAPSVGLERHYDTLGLRNGASSRDVVRAYMQQARQLHTQQYSQDAGEAGIAQSRMQAINEAFRAIKLAQRPKTTPPGRSDSVDDHLNRGQVVLTGATSAASRRDSNGPRAPRRLKRSGREAQLPWSVNRGW